MEPRAEPQEPGGAAAVVDVRVGPPWWALVAGALMLLGIGLGGGWMARARWRGPAAQSVGPQEAEDTDHDGRPDRWTQRDGQGRPVRVSLDTNRDGRPDRTEIFVGARLNRVDYDSDGDGRYDATDQVGDNGRPLLRLSDRDWNSVPERWVQLDARGRITAEWIDANQDSAPERFRAFDPAGRMTEEGTDGDADGLYEVNRIYNTRWPAGSPPVRIERDDDRDGIFERRETYTAAGVLRAVNVDSDGDGIRDHLTLLSADGTVRKEGFDRDGDGSFESWRFPVPGGSRVGYDDDDDYDLDRWDAPGPPPNWCAARCAVGPRPDAGGVTGDGGVARDGR